MAISAKDVAKLRKMTGAGMMDSKKALQEADGDFDKAIELLRKKGQKIAGKRADREAKEGAVFVGINDDQTKAFLIELNSETDFVAKNDDFQSLGQSIVALAVANEPASTDELHQLKMEDGRPVEAHVTDAMGKIGEKIVVSKYEVLTGDQVVTYVHPGSRIAVAVAFNGGNGSDLSEVGKDVAMQITAMNPAGVDKDDVPQDVVDKEIEIGRELAINEGKPADLAEKISRGRLNKFFKENTLLNQEFVKDTSKSVGQFIKDEAGKDVKVVGFKRVQLGA